MRTAAERDEVTLVIVTAIVRFVSVIACVALLLAVAEIAVGVDQTLYAWALMASVVLGLVLAVRTLVRGGRGRQ
jgi:hypothetical protein